MAMLLRREFGLIAFTVTLQTADGTPHVLLRLEAPSDIDPPHPWSFKLTIAQIGLLETQESKREASFNELALPPAVVDEMQRWLDDIHHDGPIWLHLIKPYGHLGGVAWERLLAGCGRVILRLPDALSRAPVEAPGTLNVVLCASPPASEDLLFATHLALLADAIVSAVHGRSVRIFVFADPRHHDQVKRRLLNMGQREDVVLVDYDIAEQESIVCSPSERAHPWLQWMTRKMSGIAVDVVHFFCDGYLAKNSGCLALPLSATADPARQCSPFVCAEELENFLITIGAWSVAFTAPDGAKSSLGLRTLADKFAQTHPGPILHHDFPIDARFQELGASYQFLYSTMCYALDPMPAIALCCQPAIAAAFTERRNKTMHSLPSSFPTTDSASLPDVLREEIDGQWHELGSEASPADETTDDSPANAEVLSTNETLDWLGPGQRYVEAKEYEVQRRKKLDSNYKSRARPDLEGIANGLDDIKAALQRLAKKGAI